MSNPVNQLLEMFDSLSRRDQHEVLSEILRRNGELIETMQMDRQLIELADILFQALDAEEAGKGESGP